MSYVTDIFDDEIAHLLEQGGVGFMPSDTIYGLSCRALDEVAVNKIHQIKNRALRKPFIVLISNLSMLDLLSISSKNVADAKKCWPGALTLVCPALNSPAWLHQDLKTLAIRMPDKQELLDLIDKVGPLISTSANIEGQKPTIDVLQAKAVFGDRLDFYVDKGVMAGQPSTVVSSLNGKLEVIRQGDVRI